LAGSSQAEDPQTMYQFPALKYSFISKQGMARVRTGPPRLRPGLANIGQAARRP